MSTYRTSYTIDSQGRVWSAISEYHIDNRHYDRCGDWITDCSCSYNWRSTGSYTLVEGCPIMDSKNGITRFLSLNKKLRNRDNLIDGNKVITAQGEIYSLDSDRVIDDSRVYSRLVELRNNQCYKLDVEGNLYLNDTLIMDKVTYLGYIGVSGVLIGKSGVWQYKLNPDMDVDYVEGDSPFGEVLSQRGRLIRTDRGIYQFIIRLNRVCCEYINISEFEDRIVDMIDYDDIYILGELGLTYRVRNGVIVSIEPLLMELIHNSDPIKNLYLEGEDLLLSTQSGKLFSFQDGIKQFKKYNDEMFRKYVRPMKSAASRIEV